MSDYDRHYVEENRLPGNPFTTEDALYTEDSNNSSVVNATLALAHEQRTASLISVHAQLLDEETNFLSERVDGLELARQIVARLGLA